MALLLILALGQTARCDAGAMLLPAAVERAASFDVGGAIARLARVPADCAEARVQLWYLRGLSSAREAYRYGGSRESLEPVTDAMTELSALAAVNAAGADAARVVLLAASAAAQSEREELGLLVAHARQLERRQARGTLIIPLDEVEGDLWLQVHRFDDARRAYQEAVEQRGPTPRAALGLARVAARLNDAMTACREYRALMNLWESREEPPELTEARAFVRVPACADRPALPRQ
jgi:hypothetical protein